MRVLLAILAIAALAACDQRAARDDEAMFEAIRADINDLRRSRDLQDKQLTSIEKWAKTVDADLNGINNDLSHNSKVSNQNAARIMTVNGACGQETYYDAANVARTRNRTCTEADLRK